MRKMKVLKKIILPGMIVLLISSTLFAQHSLEKLWQTDTLTLKNPESVLFDPLSNSLYVSSMSAGAIVHYSLDGKLLDQNLALSPSILNTFAPGESDTYITPLESTARSFNFFAPGGGFQGSYICVRLTGGKGV